MIRGYAEGWGCFKRRIHGKPDEERHDDLPDVSPEAQQVLSQFAMREIKPDA